MMLLNTFCLRLASAVLAGAPAEGEGGVGSPIGLLLTLTQAE